MDALLSEAIDALVFSDTEFCRLATQRLQQRVEGKRLLCSLLVRGRFSG
jgi:hypothetical protein